MALTKTQLHQKNVQTTYPNLNRLVQAQAQQEFFANMIDAMYPDVQEEVSTIPAYDPEKTYQPGGDVYVLFSARLWQFVSETAKTGIEPGTNTDIWKQIDPTGLAHPQNTDFKISRISQMMWLSGTYDLTNKGGLHIGRNFFIAAWQGPPTQTQKWLEIRTVNGTERADHEFVVRNGSLTETILFENTDFQYVGTSSLMLPPGHFAVFQGAINSPGGGLKTMLKYTSSPASSGSNPFNQSLNKTDNAIFNSLVLSNRIGTGIRAAVYNADGLHDEKPLKNINDVVKTQEKYIDQATGLETVWQVINGVWTNVTP
jgi:hypothetical protein